MLHPHLRIRRRAIGKCHITRWLVRSVTDASHIANVHRFAIANRNHQIFQFRDIRQIAPGLDLDFIVVDDLGGQRGYPIAQGDRLTQLRETNAVSGKFVDIRQHAHDLVNASNGVDVTGARHALELHLDAMRNMLHVIGAFAIIIAPQG